MLDGRFEGKEFVLPIRIYYEDTDLSGFVYHANYLRFMERGRTEFFRHADVGVSYLDDAEPAAWALRKLSIEYLRPARIEDLVEVRTRAASLTGVRLTADQFIFCGQTLLTRASVEACVVTVTGKLRRIPPEVRDKLLPFLLET